MKISEYIDRRDKLVNTKFIITSQGNGVFIEDGIQFTREEFNKKYPLPVSFVMHNSENSDKTKSYLHTD